LEPDIVTKDVLRVLAVEEKSILPKVPNPTVTLLTTLASLSTIMVKVGTLSVTVISTPVRVPNEGLNFDTVMALAPVRVFPSITAVESEYVTVAAFEIEVAAITATKTDILVFMVVYWGLCRGVSRL